MEQPVIEAFRLVRSYDGRPTVMIDDLRIDDGDILAILGRNGSGKSTLLRLLCLLDKPSAGEIFFHGERLGSDAERLAQRRRMAMVFQEPLLFSGTVRFNVSYGLSIRRLDREQVRSRCDEMLSLLGISHLAERGVETLSGGEAQRVSLARALAVRPEILFLDEPMANLDSPTRQAFRRDLARVLADLRCTAVYVTHEVSEAMYLGNRIAVMSGGRIIQDASPAEVWECPATVEVASLVGIDATIPGTVLGRSDGFTRIRCGDTEVVSSEIPPESRDVRVCVRPEHVLVSGEAAHRATNGHANRLCGLVKDIEPLGMFSRVTIDCGFAVVANVPTGRRDRPAFRRSDRVVVSFAPASVHLIDVRLGAQSPKPGQRQERRDPE